MLKLDLNLGNQPMISSNSNLVIVYNGEIVNFLELRDLLKSKKIYLKSNNYNPYNNIITYILLVN